MPYTKSVLCLAASWKRGGTCIAGKVYGSGRFHEWIRPVSDRQDEEISDDERLKDNGYLTDVLDIVDITFECSKPNGHQSENALIVKDRRWVHRRMLPFAHLHQAIDRPRDGLWLDGFSSGKGENDCIPSRHLDGVAGSLLLLQPDRVVVHFGKEEKDDGALKPTYRTTFELGGTLYNWAMTDRWVAKKLRGKPPGDYPVESALLCASLSEVMNDHAYKLAASVIVSGRSKLPR